MILTYLLAQTDAPTGALNFANALVALFVVGAVLAGLGLIISSVRESHGAWQPVLGSILLVAVILFFVRNTGVLDGIIRATVTKFWG